MGCLAAAMEACPVKLNVAAALATASAAAVGLRSSGPSERVTLWPGFGASGWYRVA